MFEPSDRARVYGLPPGVDFPRAVLSGLMARLGDQPPEALARIEIFVSTRRMQRRMKAILDEGPARLLPRIRLITDLGTEAAFADIPPPVSALRRRLELSQLVARLLDTEPDLAPKSALFDLADSLANLMDEMQGEAVPPEAIRNLDVSDVSGHWQRALKFVNLVEAYFGDESRRSPDAETRQRMVVEHLADRWTQAPPTHPVLVAGSTGSRGATSLFMEAVARLPQGALILPGVDLEMPRDVWEQLDDAMTGEDHPQFRFVRLLDKLGLSSGDIETWSSVAPPSPARNRLVSLALRPAPVTDQWMRDGKTLTDIGQAAEDVTLIEAPSSRLEASAIALVLRNAVEQGRIAALVTPDRTLTRQVSAALDRWGIVADDSAGRPLPLTAPGRFLRHVAGLFGVTLTAEALLTLLKHPVTNTGSGQRGTHLLQTRELELKLRKKGPPFPTPRDLIDWAADGDAERQTWARWLAGLIEGLESVGTRSLTEHLAQHIALAERLAAGPVGEGAGKLWQEEEGREALRWVTELRQEAGHGGDLSPADYQALFHAVLQRGEVRETVTVHPGVMIWGTLEARVQGAELVVLGGLNEGVWPEAPKPDPWLNRTLRDRVGLLLPERRIGLSAHDFQQAVAARHVVLSRAIRDAEAQTVPSRWLNRLTNLMSGVSGDGAAALQGMRDRGARWLAMAETFDAPRQKVTPAPRPSPQPPLNDRPRKLSITEIQTLIRDPYAVYARRVLRLSPLDPIRHQPDAPLRGTVMHEVFERFIREAPVTDFEAARARLIGIADEVLRAEAPWPAARRIWRAKLLRIVDWFVTGEIERQTTLTPIAWEAEAAFALPDVDVTLTGKVDRIDRTADGQLVIYDYKTGKVPTAAEQEHFDKQLALAAMLAERGGLKSVEPAAVREVAYIGVGTSPKIDTVALESGDTQKTFTDLMRLLATYRDRQRGYTSRRAVERVSYGRDYDHLARYGEWDESFDPVAQEVGG